MKKIIIYLCSILLSGSIQMIFAQESKYFNLEKRSTLVFLSPKHLEPGLQERTKGNNTWGDVNIHYNRLYFDTFMPIYKDVFGSDFKYKGDKRNLRRIDCWFWFREDFKPYYYQISFPTALLDEFPQWEEKLYRLCEKSMKVDVRPFVDPRKDQSNFEWSNFEINLMNLYLFSEGNLRLDYY